MSSDLIHQFVKVLRFKAGERVILLDGSGFEYEVELGQEVAEKNPKLVAGTVVEKRICATELPFKLVLAFGILKNPEKIEWILQKGTELGVSEFVPLITQRTEKKSLFKVDRLRRILKEAAEQSGRGVVPELADICDFEKFVKVQDGIVVVPHPGAEKLFKDIDLKNHAETVNVCIGPEGGFTEQEIDFVFKKGAFLVNLGLRILRAETAAIVTVAFISCFPSE